MTGRACLTPSGAFLFRNAMSVSEFQLVIVGGGPAGLTAGLYAARARLHTLLLEKGAVGGQVLVTDWVDNYPGFPEGIAGFELIDKMAAQAARFDLKIRNAPVASMDLTTGVQKIIVLENGDILSSQAVIIACGARPNQLGIPGEIELTGKGVSYCATCDGPFYRDQEIVVVGGGDTAVQEAIHLTKFARKVTVIHRRDQLRATKILQERAFANQQINFIWNSQLTAITGSSAVESVTIRGNDGQPATLKVTGVFVLIGTKPNSEFLPHGQLEFDDAGFLKTDAEMCTNIPGVMAVGDIRSKTVRQIANAVGEGAVAALAAEEYLNEVNR